MEGETVTGYRLSISYTCTAVTAVQASFCSDVVECLPLDQRVSS